jgi:hypothetical protein
MRGTKGELAQTVIYHVTLHDAGVPLMSRSPNSETGKLFASVAGQVERRFEELSREGR